MNDVNPITTKKRAVIYSRVSTKEQAEEGSSLITQVKIGKTFAHQHGYEVVEIFIEEGESAKTTDRKELKRLLSFCTTRKNHINAIIVYKIDRLSRNVYDYGRIRLLLKKYNVEIKSTTEFFEDDPAGRFMENIIANVAQFDNDVRAERCSDGMKNAMHEGRYVWMAPIGYNNVTVAKKATIAPNNKKAPIIKRTFQLIAQNTVPIEEIRKKVIKKGLVNKTGKPISKSYFYKLLRNEVYAGWIVKFGERHKGVFEPIVSEELFNQVQRVLSHRGHKVSQYITDNPEFPLRRFVTDPSGAKLTGSWSKGRSQKYPYYRFGMKGSNYNRDLLENDFTIFMDRYGFDERHYKKLMAYVENSFTKATKNRRKEEKRLRNHIEELEEKQNILIQKNIKKVISDQVLKQQLKLIEKELYETNDFISNKQDENVDYEEVVSFAEDYLKKPSKIWEQANTSPKIKLQWFQFPSGVIFDGEKFGTTKIASLFKVKSALYSTDSSNVDLGFQFWNQFKKECIYLAQIIKEIKATKQSKPSTFFTLD